MIVIPAIDLKDGRCVRLEQGRMDSETVYSNDPVETALKWQELGASLIHIVDLDAACEGRPVNSEVIQKIARAVDVPLQIGGGIRNMHSAEVYLANDKIKRIVVGTAAINDQDFLRELTRTYPGRVAIGIDAKDGKVAINGWVTVSDTDALELAKKLEDTGAACIIYTDISRDGMLSGPNLKATQRVVDTVSIPVIASGGVSVKSDIADLKGTGAIGVIVGKALYSGSLDLKEAIKIASE